MGVYCRRNSKLHRPHRVEYVFNSNRKAKSNKILLRNINIHDKIFKTAPKRLINLKVRLVLTNEERARQSTQVQELVGWASTKLCANILVQFQSCCMVPVEVIS